MKEEKCLLIIGCIAAIALLILPETYEWLAKIF